MDRAFIGFNGQGKFEEATAQPLCIDGADNERQRVLRSREAKAVAERAFVAVLRVTHQLAQQAVASSLERRWIERASDG